MELKLRPEEVDLLKRLLAYSLTELKMEISGTDSFTMRQRLKHDEELIKGLLTQLERSGVVQS